MSERLTIGTGIGTLDALRILDAAAEAARDVPDGYALREAVLCAVEALRGEHAAHDIGIGDLRARLAVAESEAARLQRLFDDAGEGVCDVLGLIDHYQALSREDLRARWDAEAMVSGLRQRLASIARDASGALPASSGGQGVGPSASYHAMVRALDRIAAVASIGAEEGES